MLSAIVEILGTFRTSCSASFQSSERLRLRPSPRSPVTHATPLGREHLKGAVTTMCHCFAPGPHTAIVLVRNVWRFLHVGIVSLRLGIFLPHRYRLAIRAHAYAVLLWKDLR